jgi:hypothetical protein
MSHSWIEPWEEVDSWLLVVGSQTVSLTSGPSFAHNLGCRCPNGSCEAILDIYSSRPFQRTNVARRGDLTLQIVFWVFGNPGGLQVSTFGSGSCILPLCPKWGGDNQRGFQIGSQFESFGYHIEWCPLWNPSARFHIMWELGLWNPNQISILILLKP